MTVDTVSLPFAFLGGLLSFLSPCVLPLVPSYVSFVTGISFEELTDDTSSKKLRKIIMVNSGMFILGFSAVFILLLGASARLVSGFFLENQDIIRIIGGGVIILLGIHIIGIINVGVLNKDKRMHFFRDKPAGLIGSFLVGVGFAAGWTPCIGPILAGIFAMASTPGATVGSSMLLFAAYSLGLAVPFFLTALGVSTFLKHFKNHKHHMKTVSIVTGILLIITGGLIMSGSMTIMTGFFSRYLPYFG